MDGDAEVITATLELVSKRAGDPTPHVFRRLFTENPEVEALCVRDEAGLLRGQMFQVTIESLSDFMGDRTMVPTSFRSNVSSIRDLVSNPMSSTRFM